MDSNGFRMDLKWIQSGFKMDSNGFLRQRWLSSRLATFKTWFIFFFLHDRHRTKIYQPPHFCKPCISDSFHSLNEGNLLSEPTFDRFDQYRKPFTSAVMSCDLNKWSDSIGLDSSIGVYYGPLFFCVLRICVLLRLFNDGEKNRYEIFLAMNPWPEKNMFRPIKIEPLTQLNLPISLALGLDFWPV